VGSSSQKNEKPSRRMKNKEEWKTKKNEKT